MPDESTGFVSTIATPHINTFKKRIDLAQVQMIAQDEVKETTLFTNVLSHTGESKTKLPGLDVVLVSQILDFRSKDGRPRRLQLTDAAFRKYVMRCRDCLGALLVTDDGGGSRHTVVDGFRYVLTDGPDGRYGVAADLDLRTPPPVELLPRLMSSFEFAFTYVQAVVSDRRVSNTSGLQILIQEFLSWLTEELIPESTARTDALLDLRIRCLDLAKLVGDPSAGSFVPILPFLDYEKEAEKLLAFVGAIDTEILEHQRQIDFRKQQELLVNVGKDLNEAIIQSGKLLVGIVKAGAAQQERMAEFYDEIVKRQVKEQALQQKKTDGLEQAVNEQRASVLSAVDAYKMAVKEWQKLEWVKFGLDLSVGLLQLGFSIVIPANAISSVVSLGLTGQRIQKLLNVLTATNKLYTDVNKTKQAMENAQGALDKLDEFDNGVPADLAWDEMDDNLKEVLATGPDGDVVKVAKARLSKEFTILARRGKAWLSALGETQKLSRDIYFNQRQRDMNREQAARLKELEINLDPPKGRPLDRDKIDLIGLTGSLSFMRNQALVMLSTAFTLQDQARQYEFLQPPTPIQSFSLLTFRGAVARQETATVTAKAALARLQSATTTPIEFVIDGVEVESLTGGNAFTVGIRLDSREFLKYVHARVLAVVVRIDGIASTDSSEYLVDLAFGGDPYLDRDTARESMTFRTPPRQRTYEYQLPDNTPKFTDRGYSWSEGVSPVTPFSAWQISISPTKTNKGLAFKGTTVRICLSFVLKTRIKDAPPLRLRAQTDGTLVVPTKDELILEMSAQGSVVNGWDVVYNMALDQINATMAAQDRREQARTSLLWRQDQRGHAPSHRGQRGPDHALPHELRLSENRVLAEQRQAGQDRDGDQFRLGAEMRPGRQQRSAMRSASVRREHHFYRIRPSQQDRGPGQAGEGWSADLQRDPRLHQGQFRGRADRPEPRAETRIQRGGEGVFRFQSRDLLINTLDLSKISTLDAMRPNEFRFKTWTTPANVHILQLFIMTGNRPALHYDRANLNNCDEPLPYGYESSMMISSRVFYDAVLASSLNQAGWTIAGVPKGGDPANVRDSWYGKYTSGAARGTLDLLPLYDGYQSGPHSYKIKWAWLRIGYVPPPPRFPPAGGPAAYRYSLDWPISGMTIRPVPMAA